MPPLPPAATPIPVASPDAWAQVYVRDQLTRYHRRGAGRPVLLLVVDPPADPGRDDVAVPAARAVAWPALADALAARFRTIEPEPPAPGASTFAAWLRDFLDGLGVDAAALVAAGRLGEAVLAFADSDAERVARVLLLDEAGAACGSGAAAVPVLVVVGRDAAALDAAVAFLEADDAPATRRS